MRPHGFRLETAHDGTRSGRARPTGEEHYASSAAGDGKIHQARGHGKGAARAPCHSLIGRDGPGILAQIVKDRLQRHAALANGEEETFQDVGGRSTGTGTGTVGLLRIGTGRTAVLLLVLLRVLGGVGHVGIAPQQLANLTGRVLLVPPEDVRFGYAAESQLVNLNVGAEGDQTNEGIVGEEIDSLLEAVGQFGKLFGHGARIDAEEEGGRSRGRYGR
mmetsp:Transcript_8200/g.17148  ORF Transcript_8200/g.17148 Transcript_8200/m.17148 type:complete len:218 (-) Transcript_8200:166-819(-)